MPEQPTTVAALCPDAATLDRYLRAELAAADAELVEGHVASCSDCRQAVDRLRASHQAPTATFLGATTGTFTGDQSGSATVRLSPSPTVCPRTGDEAEPDLDGYDTIGQMGAGGMGVVWRVRDQRFQRPLAIKVLRARRTGDPRWLRRFEDEARITGQLTHPYIVPVHAMGRLADGRPYYTMKLVEGRTLAELLEDRPEDGPPASRPGAGGLSPPAPPRTELVQVFGQVCQALAFAHSRGVIHRDLKPANVMVGAHGEVQVMDWGLAKVLDDTRTDPPDSDGSDTGSDTDESGYGSDHTRPGSVLGTFAYMPPEQARGHVREVDRRSDVFGLGAILCQILTGEPPYVGVDRGMVRWLAEEGRVDGARARLRECGADPELVRLTERCLAPNRADRPADATAVAAAVADHLTGLQERAQQERLERERQQVWAAARRRRRLWVALAAVLAAAVTGAVFAAPYVREQYKQRQLRRWAEWAERYHPAYQVTTSYRAADGKAHLALARVSTSPGDPDPDQVITAVFHRAGQDGLLDRVVAVDLTGLGLTRVPPEVFVLPRLSALHLGGNYLTELPADVGRLTDLTTLVLAQNLLEALPAEIERLDKLAVLDLADNSFKAIPPEVFRIPSLTSLSLRRNERMTEQDLPPAIGTLVNLTYLDLGRTNLKTLPPDIGRLAKLTKLHIPRNNLTELPPEIGRLRTLAALHLSSNNKLTRLPPEIGAITGLAELYAAECALTDLPPEIGRLANLTTLHLSGNQLTEVPPKVADLRKLRAIDLRNNVRDGVLLKELPAELTEVLRQRRTAVQLGTGPSAGGAGHVHGSGKGGKK